MPMPRPSHRLATNVDEQISMAPPTRRRADQPTALRTEHAAAGPVYMGDAATLPVSLRRRVRRSIAQLAKACMRAPQPCPAPIMPA
jgi:hypothetical protein